MKKLLGVFLLVGLLLAGSQVFAETILDSKIYWPNWSNGTGDDSEDYIGSPNITKATTTFSDGKLTKIDFTVKYINTNVIPGDLFIDRDNNGYWDYVVDLLGNRNGTTLGFDSGTYQLYQVKTVDSLKMDNKTPGVYTESYFNGSYRDNHPVAYNVTDNLDKVSNDIVFDITKWNSTNTTQTFNFGANDILLGSQFTIGWAQQCANDVYYETFNNPVPEPASMLLMGSGLIGLAGWGRKKFFKKETVVA